MFKTKKELSKQEIKIKKLQKEVKELQEKIEIGLCKHKHTKMEIKEYPIYSKNRIFYFEICENCGAIINKFKNELEFKEAELKKVQKEINKLKI